MSKTSPPCLMEIPISVKIHNLDTKIPSITACIYASLLQNQCIIQNNKLSCAKRTYLANVSSEADNLTAIIFPAAQQQHTIRTYWYKFNLLPNIQFSWPVISRQYEMILQNSSIKETEEKLNKNSHRSHGTMTEVSRPPLYANTTLFSFPRSPAFLTSATSFTSSLATIALTPANQKPED